MDRDTSLELLNTKVRVASILFNLGHCNVSFIGGDNPKWVQFRDQTRGQQATVKIISYESIAKLAKGLDINTSYTICRKAAKTQISGPSTTNELDKWSNDPSVVLSAMADIKSRQIGLLN